VQLPALRQEARQMIVALEMAGGVPPEEVTADGSAAALRHEG
jgi:hypothetical protein